MTDRELVNGRFTMCIMFFLFWRHHEPSGLHLWENTSTCKRILSRSSHPWTTKHCQSKIGSLWKVRFIEIFVDLTTVPVQILWQSWLERHFVKKSTLCAKFLIITVIYGSNLNATASKNPGQKLERHRSLCACTVYTHNHRVV